MTDTDTGAEAPRPTLATKQVSAKASSAFSLQTMINGFTRWLAIISLAVAILAEGPKFLFNISQYRIAIEAADNAARKQRAVAEETFAHAQKELAVAKNASVKMNAEASQAAAEADKIEQELISKQNEARNATVKAKADADTLVGQAQLNRQEALTKLAEAQVAALAKKTEADKAEQDVKTARLLLRKNVYVANLINCPGVTYIAKIEAAYNGQCDYALKH